MHIIYKCPECQKIIEELEVDSFDEESLGFNILTPEEKKDIIKVKYDNVYINLTCDDCIETYNWNELIYNQQIH